MREAGWQGGREAVLDGGTDKWEGARDASCYPAARPPSGPALLP